MTEDIERVLDKAVKLKNLAESEKEIGNVEAAENIAALLQRLLLDYKLSMSEVEYKKHKEDSPIGQHHIHWKEHGLKYRFKRIPWMELLAGIIAAAHGCRLLVREKNNAMDLVGREANRKVAEYVIVTLIRAGEKLQDAEYRKFYQRLRNKGKAHEISGFRAAFIQSFVLRIAERLDEELNRKGPSGSTAVVLMNQDLAQIDDSLKGLKESKPLKEKSAVHAAGWKRGREVADSMDLKGNSVEGRGGKRGELRG